MVRAIRNQRHRKQRQRRSQGIDQAYQGFLRDRRGAVWAQGTQEPCAHQGKNQGKQYGAGAAGLNARQQADEAPKSRDLGQRKVDKDDSSPQDVEAQPSVDPHEEQRFCERRAEEIKPVHGSVCSKTCTHRSTRAG
jgi:hypothetical protein